MHQSETFKFQWDYVLQCLPELEHSAQAFGALVRRREIQSAETLLRLALVYGYCDYSLRETAAWAVAQGVAEVSDVALLKRFRRCPPWLGHLLASKVAERAGWRALNGAALRLRLVDASCVSAPGSRGADWRLHLGFDLQRLSIDHVQWTDVRGGERLDRFDFAPGELVIADRGYAHRGGLWAVARARAFFLVRMHWRTLPLEQRESDAPFDLLRFARQSPEARPRAAAVIVRHDNQRLPCRVLVVRKSAEAAAQARAKVLKEATRKQRSVDPRTLEMAEYTVLITNAPETLVDTPAAFELYRYRWQIELAFKRLKSLLHLDRLRAREPPLAQTYLLAKLLAALLIEDLTMRYLDFSPWGFPLASPNFPVAPAARLP